MIKTVEAVIDEQGNVRLLEPVHPGQTRRALAKRINANAVILTQIILTMLSALGIRWIITNRGAMREVRTIRWKQQLSMWQEIPISCSG